MINIQKQKNNIKDGMLVRWLFAAVAALLLLTPLYSKTAYAAGSLAVSVEPATGSFQTGSTNALNLYGTTSGANTSGFSFTVTLTNMTISSFDATGNPFSLDSIASGGAAGSTSVTITTGYSNPVGGSGKQFVGKLYVVAASNPGSASASISGVEAYDSNLAPMTGTSSNGSYSLTAPPATPPATPAPAAQAPATTKVTVPTGSSSAAVGETVPEVVSQVKVNEILTTEAPDIVKSSAPVAKKKKSNTTLYVIIGSGLIFVALCGAIGRKYLIQRKNNLFTKQHTASTVVDSQPLPKSHEQPPATIIQPDNTNQGHN